MGKYRPRQHPNLPTVQRLKQVGEYRERNRDQWGRPPTWTKACRAIGIDPRTVRRHIPELLEKWDDREFHW